MKTLIAILKSLCLPAAIFALAEAGLAFRKMAKLTKAAEVTVTEAGGAAAELRKTATAVSEYAQHQTKHVTNLGSRQHENRRANSKSAITPGSDQLPADIAISFDSPSRTCTM